jgi:hypothetical protein
MEMLHSSGDAQHRPLTAMRSIVRGGKGETAQRFLPPAR